MEDGAVLRLQQFEDQEGVVLADPAEEVIVLLGTRKSFVVFGQDELFEVLLDQEAMLVVACALEEVDVDAHDLLVTVLTVMAMTKVTI